MTKAEHIDFIRNSLRSIDKTGKFLRPQVGAAINNAVNTVFWEMYDQSPKVMWKSMERYTTSMTLAPTTALGSARYTATLIVDVVDLPRKAGGILEIDTITGLGGIDTTTTTYVPVSTMEGEQFYGSEASLPDNIIGFSFSGARQIEFWNMDAATAALGVNARVIQQFKSYNSTDNVVLPFGQDERIMELVRQYLGVIPPKDLINNNSDG